MPMLGRRANRVEASDNSSLPRLTGAHKFGLLIWSQDFGPALGAVAAFFPAPKGHLRRICHHIVKPDRAVLQRVLKKALSVCIVGKYVSG